MNYLTINFSPHLENSFKARFKQAHSNSHTVIGARLILEENDFSYVIEDARDCHQVSEHLALLLAITPVSTHIIALVSPSIVPDREYWHAQGASLLYCDCDDNVIDDVLAAIRQGSPSR